jgi:molecular chaperone GrpE
MAKYVIPVNGKAADADETVRVPHVEASEDVDWCDRALRMQADMENYRKRQRRIAREEAGRELDRLLLGVVSIADNLDRALASADKGSPLRQGVSVTRDEVTKLLRQHDIERIEDRARSFDPEWQEAVGVVPAGEYGVRAGTVVRVVQPGYRRGDHLFRPARVLVAQ